MTLRTYENCDREMKRGILLLNASLASPKRGNTNDAKDSIICDLTVASRREREQRGISDRNVEATSRWEIIASEIRYFERMVARFK